MRPALALLLLLGAGCRTRPLDAGGDGGLDDAEYTAQLLPTALNRISIQKIDQGRDICFSLLLVNPMSTNPFGIKLPPNWAVQDAWASRPAESCSVFVVPAGGVRSMSGAGSVTFDANRPCQIMLDAHLRFSASGFPADEHLQATIPLRDAGC